jgi:hypothetical protein
MSMTRDLSLRLLNLVLHPTAELRYMSLIMEDPALRLQQRLVTLVLHPTPKPECQMPMTKDHNLVPHLTAEPKYKTSVTKRAKTKLCPNPKVNQVRSVI